MLWNSNGNPQSRIEEFILLIRPVLRVLSVLSATAVVAVVALSTVDSDRSVGLVG